MVTAVRQRAVKREMYRRYSRYEKNYLKIDHYACKVQATVIMGSWVEIPPTTGVFVADILYRLQYTSECNLRAF